MACEPALGIAYPDFKQARRCLRRLGPATSRSLALRRSPRAL